MEAILIHTIRVLHHQKKQSNLFNAVRTGESTSTFKSDNSLLQHKTKYLRALGNDEFVIVDIAYISVPLIHITTLYVG